MKDIQKGPEKDIQLDIPAEANRDKHINFRESETGDTPGNKEENGLTERQKQWKEGLAEGERARREQSPEGT